MTAHLPQLRAMLAFERSLVDRVGPPGCAARETAAANVAALEWVIELAEEAASIEEIMERRRNEPPCPPTRIWGGLLPVPPGYDGHDAAAWATRYGETYRRPS